MRLQDTQERVRAENRSGVVCRRERAGAGGTPGGERYVLILITGRVSGCVRISKLTKCYGFSVGWIAWELRPHEAVRDNSGFRVLTHRCVFGESFRSILPTWNKMDRTPTFLKLLSTSGYTTISRGDRLAWLVENMTP